MIATPGTVSAIGSGRQMIPPLGRRLARFGAVAIVALVCGLVPARAQTSAGVALGVDPALIEDIVVGSRVLADFGVVDGFGHVSARHPTNPKRFLMSRSLAPALVTADDIMEFDLDGNAARCARPFGVPRALHSQRNLQGAAGRDGGGATHSLGVIPFTVSQVALRPMYHNTAFLAAGAPVWDIRKGFRRNRHAGPRWRARQIAGRDARRQIGGVDARPRRCDRRAFGQISGVPGLLHRHRCQAAVEAIALGGGDINFLTAEEGAKADTVNLAVLDRIWNLWKLRVAPALPK